MSNGVSRTGALAATCQISAPASFRLPALTLDTRTGWADTSASVGGVVLVH